MAHTHCTRPEPGLGQGPGLGPGTMDFYIMLNTVHTTQGQGTIVFYFACPGPCPCHAHGRSPVQCV